MRRSGALLPVAALAIWLVAVAWPSIALLIAAAPDLGADVGEGPRGDLAIRPAGALLVETSAYAAGIAVVAGLLGWLPGRLLGRLMAGRRAFAPLAAFLLVPLCLPAYVVFYAWWQSWPADSALYAWAVERDLVPLCRQATLVLGLVSWSWPLVAWCVAAHIATQPGAREVLLRLDGAGAARRLLAHLRADAGGLGLGALLVFLVTFGNTTCFDLAQVYTFGNELRAKDALGAPAAEVLRSALPAIGLAAIGTTLVWLRLAARPARPPSAGRRGGAPFAWAAVAALWSLTVLAPLGLFATRAGSAADVRAFLALYGRDVVSSAALAAFSATSAALLAIGLALTWLDHRRSVRAGGHVQAVGWIAAALVPGTLVGVALEAAWNRPGIVGAVYGGSAILVLAHLARGGFAAALLARWTTAREARSLGDLRRTDGATGLGGMLAATRPTLVAAAVATAAVVFVFALGEVAVTVRVVPPGADPLAVRVLNDMHYQRPQAVMTAVLLLGAVAIVAAILVTLACARRRGVARTAMIVIGLVTLTAGVGGCGGVDGEAEPLRTQLAFGSPGTTLGQFSYPRCIATDARRGLVYVIDKTARVQTFDTNGTAQREWRMPAKENGKPTGVSVAPDGRVLVADTHYHRVIVYDDAGGELMRFGQYGEAPGEFIYPTDIAVGPEDRLYVAEYGGHDRIQVFAPGGTYLFEFGAFGSGPGEYDRPQSILFSADRSELYVADSCNHRIVVHASDGEWLRTFGGPGDAPGLFHYPYGLALLDDGTLLVAEFGNNRVQHVTADGRPLGLFGRLGAGDGELRYPWGVAVHDDSVFVLDSGDHRVQVMRTP